MSRFFWSAIFWSAMSVAVAAQGLSGLARLDPADSGVHDGWFGAVDVELALSQGVPFRVFTVDAPPRLVIDFSEVDFSTGRGEVQIGTNKVTKLRTGAIQPGWSRLVADLAEPMLPEDVEMLVDEASGTAVLRLSMEPVAETEFVAASAGGAALSWKQFAVAPPAPVESSGEFTVVIDPGHGGIDPGAEREGLVEKVIVLDVARQLADRLRREGINVVMTREADVFVSLEGRTAIAHRAGGSVFLSVHADALNQGGAHGATVYTLSDEASDAASALLAARHDRSDILAGLDLTGHDDEVTGVLLDLARVETEPRSEALAADVIDALGGAGGPMNRKPWRRAGFSVLKSADIPSVLVEIGFLSSARDRKNLADPAWRAKTAEALARGILSWRDADAFRSQLVRQ